MQGRQRTWMFPGFATQSRRRQNSDMEMIDVMQKLNGHFFGIVKCSLGSTQKGLFFYFLFKENQFSVTVVYF